MQQNVPVHIYLNTNRAPRGVSRSPYMCVEMAGYAGQQLSFRREGFITSCDQDN